MKASDFSLRDLEYLIAVDELRHFQAAARRCGVSQPTLSAQIGKLEGRLGRALFERGQRKEVQVTQFGAKVIDQAKRVLSETQTLLRLTEDGQKPFSSLVKMGFIATLGPYYIPHILKALRREFGDVKFSLTESLTEKLVDDLSHNRLDYIVASPTPMTAGLEEYPLFWEPFVFGAETHHRLASRPNIKLDELPKKEFLLLEDGHCLKDQVVDVCRNRNSSNSEYSATSLETLKHLVGAGLGVSLFPQLSAEQLDPKLKSVIRFIPVQNEKAGRRISLFSRKTDPNRSEIRLLVKFLKHNLPPGVYPDGGKV